MLGALHNKRAGTLRLAGRLARWRLAPHCCRRDIAKQAALLGTLAGRIYDYAPQQNAFPSGGG